MSVLGSGGIVQGKIPPIGDLRQTAISEQNQFSDTAGDKKDFLSARESQNAQNPQARNKILPERERRNIILYSLTGVRSKRAIGASSASAGASSGSAGASGAGNSGKGSTAAGNSKGGKTGPAASFGAPRHSGIGGLGSSSGMNSGKAGSKTGGAKGSSGKGGSKSVSHRGSFTRQGVSSKRGISTRSGVSTKSAVSVKRGISREAGGVQKQARATAAMASARSYSHKSSITAGLTKFVSDPVNVVTGEYIIDEVDFVFQGAMPFEIRRNYASQNPSYNGDFGHWWQMSCVPYLSLSKDEITDEITDEVVDEITDEVVSETVNKKTKKVSQEKRTVTRYETRQVTRTVTRYEISLHAAERDGSVITYVQDSHNANRWMVRATDNPELNNVSGTGIGSSKNPFHSSITESKIGSDTYLIHQNANGEKRTYKIDSYPAPNSHSRAYLEKWEDPNSNYYTFHFENDSNHGKLLKEIKSSNGQKGQFFYNESGYISKISGNGQNISYTYDEKNGDLKEVTQNNATTTYSYQLEQEKSTHRLIKENKPEGRVLENTYDSQGRVIVQKAAVGVDNTPVENAYFEYSNTKASDGTLSGFAIVKDGYGHSTKYEYQQSLITKITDPLNQTIIQEWYLPGDTSLGAYPRSLKQRTDKRGLVTQFKYDTKGNLIEKTLLGDITGDGVSNSATTKYSYNTHNRITSIIDPLGNETLLSYEDPQYPSQPTRIDRKVEGTITSSTEYTYYQVTDDEKSSKALLKQIKRAAGTLDESVIEYTHNSEGLITSEKKFTGKDTYLLTKYTYNTAGKLIEKVDPSGAVTRYSYDPAGNCYKQEHLDEKGTLLNTTNAQYNKNGEPTEIENSEEGIIRYQYDTAGRVKEEERLKSKASDPYSKIAYQHDKFGNLTEIRNKILSNGHSIKMTYDKIGQMLSKDAGGKESQEFTYEGGGEISAHTDALKGVTKKEYTSDGKLRRQENSDGSVREWRYQLDGRLSKEKLSNNTEWEISYDDVGRKITRTLKSALGEILSTENYLFDYRGNLTSYTDAENNTFLKKYDKLDRIIEETGPDSTTQAEQQKTTISYDDSKRTVTSTNVLGEKCILLKDAIGRTLSISIQDASGQKIREKTTTYSLNKIIENNGSISTTTLMEGNSITQTYADGSKQQIQYHPANNTITSINELGESTVYHYGPYGDLSKTTFPGKHEIHSNLDPAQKLYQLSMPRDLTWKVQYSQAGKQISEELSGTSAAPNEVRPESVLQELSEYLNPPAAPQTSESDHPVNPASLITRKKSHTYYTSGPHVGRLQTITDARGLIHTHTYDHFGRVEEIVTAGSVTGTQKFTYDKRGLITSTSQTSSEHEPINMTRAYSAYGNLIEENISINEQPHQKTTQKWDAAGRRSEITTGDLRQEFTYQADGQLAQTRLPAQNKTISYTYGVDGLLREKKQGNISQKLELDSRGRTQTRTTQINKAPFLTEILDWRANSTMTSYQTQYPGNNQQNRAFTYDSQGQLASETYPKNAKESGTITYEYENSGLGVLTRGHAYVEKDNSLDPWGRPTKLITEDGELKIYFFGQAYPNAKVRVELSGVKYNTLSGLSRWSSEPLWGMPAVVRAGEYVSKAEAYDPQTQQTVRAGEQRTFTVEDQPRYIEYEYDGQGNLIKRNIEGTPRGGTVGFASGSDPVGGDSIILQHHNNNNISQYTWDAWGRLVKVVREDQSREKNKYEWRAIYDTFGRRLKTVYTVTPGPAHYIPIKGGPPIAAENKTLLSYYDPEVEFLEVGVKVNEQATTWKMYGLDKDGTHGGLQGIGGLEAIITPTKTYSVINDGLGHTVAMHDGTETKMNLVKVGAFGPLPGNQNLFLSSDRDLAEVTNWLGKRIDPTGLYWLGARYYDFTLARFISPDPYGHFGSFDLYSYAQNDGINFTDPDGRLGKGANTGYKEGAAFNANSTFAYNAGVAVGQLGRHVQNQARDAYHSAADAAFNAVPGAISGLSSVMGYGMDAMGIPHHLHAQANSINQVLSPSAQAGSYNPNSITSNFVVAASAVVPAIPIGIAGKVSAAEKAAKALSKPSVEKALWGFWGNYPKVTENGHQYAQIGDRLFTQHAVDRMTPSGFGRATGKYVGDSVGRSISPNFVESVIMNGNRTDVQVNGVMRSVYNSGSVEVVTEGAGRIIITVNPFKN